MKEVSDELLWEQIKNGEHPLIDYVDTPSGRFKAYETSGKLGTVCTYDRTYYVEDTKFESLSEMLDDPRSWGCKILIHAPTEDSPNWINQISLTNPNDFTVTARFTKYLRIARINLNSAQGAYEEERCRQHMMGRIRIGVEPRNNRRLLLSR